LERLIEFLKVLADPTRMKIIKFLLEGDLCVCELVEIMGIAQPTVSQHLRRLKALGLAVEKREGQRINYSLERPVFDRYLEELAAFFPAPNREISSMELEYQRYLELFGKGRKTSC
jgi:ArsR family transcriptional regulator